MRSLCGVGIYEKGKYVAYVDGVNTKEYQLWRNLLVRCYNKKSLMEKPTYKDCKVSENFKNFQFFAEWCNNQVGFGEHGWHLDKDILSNHSKEYSEYSCVFIPQELNKLFTTRAALRGKYPLGVTYHKRDNVYVAQISKNKTVHLGYFSNESDAVQAYKLAKQSWVKELAEKYSSLVDSRVYDALINWKPDN